MNRIKRFAISIAAIMSAVLFVACGSKASSLEGSWEGNDGGYDIVFTFNSDGTGYMSISGIELSITYSVDSDKITINKTVLDGTQTDDYTFKLSDKGSTLTLSNDSGDTEFKKK